MSIKDFKVGIRMERVKIFEPCDMEYDVYDKPVRFTEEFLKELASQTIGAKLVKEKHHGEAIGNVTNITFTDGALWADVSTAEALDNLKYSPSYDSLLVDNGDHWLATEGKLLEVALTSNPRKALQRTPLASPMVMYTALLPSPTPEVTYSSSTGIKSTRNPTWCFVRESTRT